MGSVISPELKLDSGYSQEEYVPGTGIWFPIVTHNFLDLHDHVFELQDEMKMIEACETELPLCLLLVKNKVARLKKEWSTKEKSNDNQVLEEFFPLKNGEDDEKIDEFREKENRDKLNWMSSVQLWCSGNQIHKTNQDNEKRREKVDESPLLSLCICETMKLKEETNSSGLSTISSSFSSSGTPSGLRPQMAKKQRKCWSVELHRRFIDAVQQLGGSQGATPKKIRELMKVQGLTNNQVKSHLQKYRLHLLRAPVTPHSRKYKESSKETKSKSLAPLVIFGSSMQKDQDEDDDISEIHNQ